MKPRILLVDDNEDLRATMTQILTEVGFDVDGVADVEGARRDLAGGPHQLVLIDWPGRSVHDWSVVDQVIADAAPARVGVITAIPGVVDEALVRGAAFALSKPFGLEALVEAVGRHATNRPLPAQQVETVHAYFDALTANDWGRLVALCDKDVTYRLPGDSELSRTVCGRDAFRAFSAETFQAFPEARFTVDAVHPLPDGAIGRYRVVWRGRSEPVSGAVLFRFDRGKIAQIGVRTDVSQLIN